MKTLLFDIETDGLLDTLTKLHSIVTKDPDTGRIYSGHGQNTWDYKRGPEITAQGSVEAALEELMEADLIIGHNIIKFDIPAIQKVYPWFQPKGHVRDTLLISRICYADMKDADFRYEKRRLKKGKEWIPKKLFGRHSLESWGHRLGFWKGDYAEIKKAEGKEKGLKGKELDRFVWAEWSPSMQEYCEQDVEVTEKLWEKLRDKIVEWGLDPYDFDPPPGKDAIQLEHDVDHILGRQERYGFAFDEKKAAALYATLVQRRGELETELQEVFPAWFRNRGRQVPKASRSVKRSDFDHTITVRRFSPKTGKELKPYVGPPKEHYTEGGRKHIVTVNGRGVPIAENSFTKVELVPFNPGSRRDVADRLIKFRGWAPIEFTNDGQAQVNEEILGKLPWPEAKLISEYYTVQKRIGQLAEGPQAWMKQVWSDGAVHGSVLPTGTVTGRMSHKGPNMAQVPGVYDKKTGELLPYGKECRELFCARPGRVIVGCDADALELRDLAGYMAKYDGGEYVSTVLDGDKSKGTDMHSRNAKALGVIREAAKTWFYAFIYGAWYFKLGVEAGATGDKQDIIKAGKKASDNFLTALPALKKLINKVKAKSKKKGYIIGLCGRRLSIRSEHSALNTLLQAAGAVQMKRALVILDRALQAKGLQPNGVDYEFVANVHDEWQIETKEEHAELIGAIAEWAIAEAGRFYDFRCPLSGSSDRGPNWAATH